MHDALAVGRWIKQRRAALDLSQEALAKQVGCALVHIRKIEAGARRPSREVAERIVDVLDVPSEERERIVRQMRAIGKDQPDDTPAPPLEPPPNVRRSRPAPPPDLIGREAEQAALHAHLRTAGRRFVTVVGPGGIGKTSLALKVAAQIDTDPAFADGVAVALLAAAATTDDVPIAIAEALGQPLRGGRPAEEQLVETLRERVMLLVLDNLEHLPGSGHGDTLAALISRLLAAAPGIRILATSRERLRLRDEWVLELGGLPVPAAGSGAGVERSEAVRLFVERARRVAPAFTLAAGSRAAVAHLCRRLEGMPLAIELAAAWTRALTPNEIAAEVDRAMDFLTLSGRDTPLRHRSMRAALDHSWSLLDEAERYALARVAVFNGGFDRDAARQ